MHLPALITQFTINCATKHQIWQTSQELQDDHMITLILIPYKLVYKYLYNKLDIPSMAPYWYFKVLISGLACTSIFSDTHQNK